MLCLYQKKSLKAYRKDMFVSKEKTLRGYKDRCKRVLSKEEERMSFK